MPYHKVIGIDLGTTYCCASIWDEGAGQVVVIPSATGRNTVPSVVGLDPEGKVIVGEPAQNSLVSDPENTIIEVKREMGVYDREPNPQTGDPGLPKKIRFRKHNYLPQEISAFILMELKRQAETFLGEPVHDAVITVPAYFKEPQKGATADAAAMARLNLKHLLNEPTAAAVCFGADGHEDDGRHIVAVYDLGGGTFDVSIIEVSHGNVSVVGTGGNPRLGGGDFDDLITDWVLRQIRAKRGVDLSADKSIRLRIKREAEMRKRDLSAATSTMINLPYLTSTISENIPISRAVFEELIKPKLEESLVCFDEALRSAREKNGIEQEDIEQVLLVGGSTRIPCIRTMLANHMGMDLRDIRVDINPDEVVARGAALVARDYAPADGYEGQPLELRIEGEEQGPGAPQAAGRPNLVLQDVTSHTLGILANREDFVPIIPKESRIPTEVSQGNFTNGGRSNHIPVLIFQGENPIAFNNTQIGKVDINLPEAREEGYYKFEVTFGLNSDGLLNVKVKETNLNQDWETQLQCNVRASREDIAKSASHLQEVMQTGDRGDGHGAPGRGAGLPAQAVSAAETAPAGTAAVGQTTPSSAGPANQVEAGAAMVAAAVPIPEPPATTPEQFRSIARRTHRTLNQTPDSEKRARLLAVYTAFVDAVNSQSPELEELGDNLEEVYIDCR